MEKKNLSVQDITPQIIVILAEILRVPEDKINPTTSLTEELDIDSLTIVRLDLLIQARLGLALSADHLEKIDSVQDLADALVEYGQPVDSME